jgi:hypothetical protein
MIEISRDGGFYRVVVKEECRARRETVYDVLADLRTHMEWGGSWHTSKTQRLQSMDAPEGPATVGMEFRSIGTTSAGSWHDRSRVTEASRPSLFEFVTTGALRDEHGQDRMSLVATHRYELRDSDPTLVIYTLTAQMELLTSPSDQHRRLPAVIFNLVVPSVIERGIRNLVRMAEERTGLIPATAADEVAEPAASGEGG